MGLVVLARIMILRILLKLRRAWLANFYSTFCDADLADIHGALLPRRAYLALQLLLVAKLSHDSLRCMRVHAYQGP